MYSLGQKYHIEWYFLPCPVQRVYRNIGQGVTFIGAWAQDAFTLAVFTLMTLTSFTWQSELLLTRNFCSLECNQQLGRTGSRNRGVAQATEMLLVHALLGMEEGQGMPQDPA
jgi:hypothetical protein